MHIGIAVIPLAAVAGWAAGAAWYGALGKQWSASLGWGTEELAQMRQQSPLWPMLFSFLAELVMALILVIVIGPVISEGIGLRCLHGAIDGAVVWLGFVVTTNGVNYAFQRRSLALLVIDAGHWLLVLLIQGALIDGFR